MSDKENELMQRDAVPSTSTQIAERSKDDSVTAKVVNNNLQLNQANTRNVIIRGNNIHHGDVHYHHPPQTKQLVLPSKELLRMIDHEKNIYLKTESISKMAKSTERLSEKYLDIFAANFGQRYDQVPILLNIDRLDIERMNVDHFNKGGSREVTYQLLYAYFQMHQEIATVGWFTKFLWKNGFRKTVHKVKDRLKQLEEIESETNVFVFGSTESEETYL